MNTVIACLMVLALITYTFALPMESYSEKYSDYMLNAALILAGFGMALYVFG